MVLYGVDVRRRYAVATLLLLREFLLVTDIFYTVF